MGIPDHILFVVRFFFPLIMAVILKVSKVF
jgi:hypothetical protein